MNKHIQIQSELLAHSPCYPLKGASEEEQEEKREERKEGKIIISFVRVVLSCFLGSVFG